LQSFHEKTHAENYLKVAKHVFNNFLAYFFKLPFYYNKMKIGVKTFNNEEFLKYFEDKANFFEVQAIQKNNYDFLKKFSKPMIIHAEHMGFGINPTDKKIYEKNLNSLNFARELADKTKSKKIILHPGHIINNNYSKEQSIYFVNSLNDKRIIIENLSPINNGICETPKEMKEFMKLTGAGFCLDINHAIQTALILGIDYMKFLKDFLKLKPVHFHIGGQKLLKEDIAHKSFKDSELNLREILKLFPKDAEITLETAIPIKEVEEDLITIREVIKEIKY
jgi:deoxyribonuclease-4